MNTQTHTDEKVLVREDGPGYTTLRLNRPQQFNSLSEPLLDALLRELQTIAQQPEVRCVVLAAAGKAFCAGHDLREMRATPKLEYYQRLFAHCGRVMQAIRDVPVPVVARVHGVATAAGCQLVAACDLAVGSASARFAVSGINAGLFCSTPSVALSRNVSTKRAFDLLVTARFIDAETAKDWGLVNEAVSDDKLDETVLELVRTIVAKSPAAIRHGKALFYQQRELDLPEAYALAADVMAHNMMEEDAGEGIDAFLQKRAPVWKP
jgi:enoyl-CoA hydratase/carnithine racemase